jgi:hypothetical protein
MLTLKTLTLFVPMYLVSFAAVLLENGGRWGAAALAAGAVLALKSLVVLVHGLCWRQVRP